MADQQRKVLERRRPRQVEVIEEDDEPVVAPPVKKSTPAPVAEKTAKAATPANGAQKKAAAPPPVQRQRRLVQTDDDEATIEDAPEPEAVEEAPTRVVKNSKLPASFNRAIQDNDILVILDALQAGETILFGKNEDGMFYMEMPAATKKGRRSSTGDITGKALQEATRSEAYMTWRDWWKSLSYEDKIAESKKAGASWEEAEDYRINSMRMAQAYRQVKGIEKYRDEYQDRSARAKLKAGK